jgi:hypothetical protein
VVSPIASLAEALNPWIAARTQTPKERKPRTVPPPSPPCPKCGGRHAIKQFDYCTGCGELRGDPRIILPETGDKVSPVRTLTPPAPLPIRRQNISGLPKEPSWLADAPDLASDDVSDPSLWHDLTDVQEQLVTASHAPTPQDERQSRQYLENRLSTIARERGKTPVPKPLPHMPAERQPDPWTDEAWL